jgi:hydroxymethylpyrimidine/phosphomethylpyrimidine kinase
MTAGVPTVLVIAGSDSSGGAGLLRDVQTLNDFKVKAACAITAITAQTHQQVIGVEHCSPRIIRQQIDSALADRNIAAIKIGMLGRVDTVQVVIDALASVPHLPVVLDPVILSSSGGALLDQAGIDLLRRSLALFTLITPNVPELAALTQQGSAQVLLDNGARAVLVKGGHDTGTESIDLFLTTESVQSFTAPRIGKVMRGTGCALASAIAGGLALQHSLVESISNAKRYVWSELQKSP